MDGLKALLEAFKLIEPVAGVFGFMAIVESMIIWKLVNIVAGQRERNLNLVHENKKLQETQIVTLQENAKVLERNATALAAIDSAYRGLAQVIQSLQSWLQTFLSTLRT